MSSLCLRPIPMSQIASLTSSTMILGAHAWKGASISAECGAFDRSLISSTDCSRGAQLPCLAIVPVGTISGVPSKGGGRVGDIDVNVAAAVIVIISAKRIAYSDASASGTSWIAGAGSNATSGRTGGLPIEENVPVDA